ncbi:hypothetical protein AAWM_06151 [Aspergillus awamori]|nr:unnamed protein product [Aspergillus niger]GCB23266.1 hypothetical protein AAWM_06151 [Aspergillus awamori]SPB52129.1 unnamed protein product [Aspergillus niger]
MFRNVLTCGHASLWHPREPTNFPADCALKASPLSTRLPYSAMMPERSSTETSIDSIRHHEKESLIESYYTKQPPRFRIYSRAHIVTLYVSNAILLLIIAALVGSLSHRPFQDPTIGVYSPANEAIEYIKQHKFRAALFEKTPYMGFPTDETDRLWQELYNFGISKIPEHEARMLPHPTLKVPGTDEYLVQLDVWHELHCLNDLRMLLYPERFPGLAGVTNDKGVIDRESIEFRHWDHCVDSIRETLMCHADVAPIPFRVNFPASKVIVPRLATTHTCRNFTKIQEWAKEHKASYWNYNVTAEQAEEIMRESGFDNAPWESIDDQYMEFPGNTFFTYWREHPEEAKAAREKTAASGL